MGQAQKLYKEVYDSLGGLKSNPDILRSYILNNTADIVKSIEYFQSIRGNLSDDEKSNIDNIIQRFENVMVQRLMITEDIFSDILNGQSSELSRNKDTEPKKEEKKPKKKKKGKMVNMKGEEIESADEVKPEAPDGQATMEQMREKNLQDSIEKEKEKFQTPYDKRYPDDDAKNKAIKEELIPRLKKLYEKREEDKEYRENQRKYVKWHFMNYGGQSNHFLTDNQIERLIDWINSGLYVSREPMDVLFERLSITDVIKEAERVVVEVDFDEKALKEHMKPMVMNQTFQEYEDVLAKTDEEYEQFFRSTLAFLAGEKHRQLLKEKYDGKSREEIKEDIFKEYQFHGNKAVGKMASKLHQMLTALGQDSRPVDRVGEIISFLKTKAPELVRLYNEKHGKKKESEKTPKSEYDVMGDKTKIEYPKLEERVKYATKPEQVKEFVLTAINKDHQFIGEEMLMSVLKNKFLKGDNMEVPEDWTIQDVSEWIAREIDPYHSGEYSILGAKDENEFRACLEHFFNLYPEGKEKQRMEAIKRVLASDIPRSAFARKIARKVRKGNMNEINAFVAAIGKQMLENNKETEE